MSDTANPPGDGPEPELETEPETYTDSGVELKLPRGNATEHSGGRVVYMDARCRGCGSVTICNVSAKEWTGNIPFADHCHRCGVLSLHNCEALLTAINRRSDRGIIPRGDGGE